MAFFPGFQNEAIWRQKSGWIKINGFLENVTIRKELRKGAKASFFSANAEDAIITIALDKTACIASEIYRKVCFLLI